VHERIPAGPLQVAVRLPGGLRGWRARLLVAGTEVAAEAATGWSRLEVGRIVDHKVVVLG
jgi:hypothetical protein